MKMNSGLNPRRKADRREGVALIIVLAFVVILTGVVVAYFSRALANRQISNSSASQTKVALFAQGAADSIIADLQAEIQLTSTPISSSANSANILPQPPATSGTFYYPIAPASMLPQLAGTGASSGATVISWAPNFLKRSANAQMFYSSTNADIPSIPSNAVAVSSTLPSLNGRSVSLARWNEHYLLPLLTGSDSTPISTGTDAFLPPDWVLVARDGSNPVPTNPSSSGATWSSTNSTTVVGRYAYAIYHEGGLLDANVAGFPIVTTNTNSQSSYKPALSYADLTVLPGLAGNQNARALVDQLVAWRNAASAQPVTPYQTTGGGAEYDPFNGAPASNGTNYFNFINSNPTGFLQISSTNLSESGTGSTDRIFSSRQELISFVKNGLGLSGTSLDLLNYLATFTRGLDQPSYTPDPTRPLIVNPYQNGGNNLVVGIGNSYELKDSSGNSDPVNPSFLTLRTSGSFTRFDGSIANKGDPLAKTRFPLSRLAWITYLGPSADRAPFPTSNPGINNPNYDLWVLISKYGISPSYLAEGTDANIYKNFGLVWAVDPIPSAPRGGTAPAVSFHDGEYKWFYEGHNALNNTPGTFNYTTQGQAVTSNTAGSISRLPAIAALTTQGREPDFFELLKASVAAGSLAKASMNLSNVTTLLTGSFAATSSPYYYQTKLDFNLDYAVIQLGANIIDQAKVDGYCTRIVFNDGNDPAHEFRGIENLPYLYRANAGTLKVRMENPQFTGTSQYYAKIVDPGVAMIMEVPTIWNPHDALSPIGIPGPTVPVSGGTNNFRLIADSVQPDSMLNQSNPINTGTTAATGAQYAGFWGFGNPSSPFNLIYGGNQSNSAGALVTGSFWTTGTAGNGLKILPSLTNSGAVDPPLIPQNSMLTFSDTETSIFREPTILAEAGIPAGSHLQFGVPPSAILQYATLQNQHGKLAYQGLTGGFLSDGSNPLNLPNAITSSTVGYLGTPAALCPIEFCVATGTPATPYAVYHCDYTNIGTSNNAGPFLTYRLQYADPNPKDTGGAGYVTYDEKFTQYNTYFLDTPFSNAAGNLTDAADADPGGSWESYADPRTARFGAVTGRDDLSPPQTPGGSTNLAGNANAEWPDPNNDVLVTDRPDVNGGYCLSTNRQPVVAGSPEFVALVANGWIINENAGAHFRIGMLEQNNPNVLDNNIRFNLDNAKNSTTGDGPQYTYYQDPDNVVRGAMGNWITSQGTTPASTTIGLPLATAYPAGYFPSSGNIVASSGTYQAESRPYFLHRPFRSVAELGYVFSGTPWKNIDFFTPQSGDVALLDVFSANEPPAPTTNPNPLVAGVVDLNTQQIPVLQAILAGAYPDEVMASSTAASITSPFTPMNATEAGLLVSSTGSLTARTASTATGKGPLINVGDLIGRWNKVLSGGTNNYAVGYTGASSDLTGLYGNAFGTTTATQMKNIDRLREAAIRPLAAVGNTRVWNLLIDVIAQTGRYPTGTSNPASFVVEGEQRYWVHVAIDRFTGQVLDKQVEVVKE